MKINRSVSCEAFPCGDVRHSSYLVPHPDLAPKRIRALMISEASPEVLSDHYYVGGDSLFERTTVQAFQDAGAEVKSVDEILKLGVYLTTAVKCGKIDYGLKASTIRECSCLLEKEIAQFRNVEVYLLMGDVAIKGFNYITKRLSGQRAIPAGSTYRIRSGQYEYGGKRVFPSYTQAGPSFFIEKSKRRMIAEDIAAALKLIGAQG